MAKFFDIQTGLKQNRLEEGSPRRSRSDDYSRASELNLRCRRAKTREPYKIVLNEIAQIFEQDDEREQYLRELAELERIKARWFRERQEEVEQALPQGKTRDKDLDSYVQSFASEEDTVISETVSDPPAFVASPNLAKAFIISQPKKARSRPAEAKRPPDGFKFKMPRPSQKARRVSSEALRIYQKRLAIKPSSLRFAVGLAGFFLIVSLAGLGLKTIFLKDYLFAQTAVAFATIQEGTESFLQFDLDKAQQNFIDAYQKFNNLPGPASSQTAMLLGRIAEPVLRNTIIGSGQHALLLGKTLSQAGKNLTGALSLLVTDLPGQSDSPRLTLVASNLYQAQKNLSRARWHMERINPALIPEEFRPRFEMLGRLLPEADQALSSFNEKLDALFGLLGQQNLRKYLIVFQNSSELRPSGGFIGSYGLVTLDQGALRELRVDDIYNIDGQLTINVVPPVPIQKISTAWSTHDANWFLDFPASAEKIIWFYDYTGSPSVDGVLAVTPRLIERLLDVTGPVALPNYGIVLNSANFLEKTRFDIETRRLKDSQQPKQILKDFAPLFLDKLAEAVRQHPKAVLRILAESIERRDFMAYLRNPAEQDLARQLGITGELVRDENEDWLAVVNANINGFKTDRVIKQTSSLEVSIGPDGQVTNSLRIKRVHSAKTGDPPWYNAVNSSYMKIYVPLGSQLISLTGHTVEDITPPVDYNALGFSKDPDVTAINNSLSRPLSGVDVFEESGATVFGFWTFVSPGETLDINIRYQSSVDILSRADGRKSWGIYWQRQPGAKDADISVAVKYPDSWFVESVWPEENFVKTKGLAKFNAVQNKDLLFFIDFE